MSTVSQVEALHYRQQVEELFDDYAPEFEASLLALGYDIPAEIVKELRGVGEGALSTTTALDLGCGTGLAGAKLRPHCTGALIGCDLSGGMIEIAESKRIYDRLSVCDAVAFLHREVEPSSIDLIVAADVTVYMRALDGMFDGVARALCPGGRFVFSTELCTLAESGGLPPLGAGWVERPSERIAHASEYLAQLVSQTPSLEMTSTCETTVRMGGDSVNGPTGQIRGNLCVVTRTAQ